MSWDKDKIINVTFPVEDMDWVTLISQRNTLVELQGGFDYIGQKPIIEALDTAISIMERLMEFYDYKISPT
jgi:hypothetical protein